MALRLIQIRIAIEEKESVVKLLEDEPIVSSWTEKAFDNISLIKVLLNAENTERILDLLEKKFSFTENFRIVMLPVEATVPRIKEEKPEEAETGKLKEEEVKPPPLRISREELYTEVEDSAKITNVYIAMVVLSAIVAAIGLLKNNVAVVIGAMVIAPLLGPNVALALSTTLGDFDLGKRALKANLLGVTIALVLSIFIGMVLQGEPSTAEITSRTNVGLSDIVLAIASGAAGALAFTSGVSATLIGVMVAVALLPPLVTLGLLLGSGMFAEAFGAFLLLTTNLICINLAGVLTFLAQGIRPRKWWEAKKAKRASRYAILLWTVLLVILIVTIIISQERIF